MDRPRRKQRTFYFGKRRNWGRCLMAAVFGVILIVSSVKLISYGVDYYNAQQASASLSEIYHAEEEPTAEATNTPAPATPPTAAPSAPPEAGPTATPPTRLQPVRYPGNFYANVSSRFQKVRRQNSDIIGWLIRLIMIQGTVAPG